MTSPSPALAATSFAPHSAGLPFLDGGVASQPPGSTPAPISSTRVTVLPRAEGDGASLHLVREGRPRYEPIRPIASGGMGEVVLVHDQDIARPVAIKRLLPELADTSALLRFVEEIRTIGQLEHPNIVPIHDVGVDEQGRYFFVMKYIEGETLAAILERLRAGDPEYHRHYTVERRLEIFLGVLNALAFAHSRGILHRDIKPANVMVGRFGEVVVMDWGIAKAFGDAAASSSPNGHDRGDRLTPVAPSGERPVLQRPSSAPERPLATRLGAFVGTPSYMAPEQALGKNDELDGRSDLYSATVLLHELMTLRHYLGEQPSVEATLAAVAGDDVSFRTLLAQRHPHQAALPAELMYSLARGLQKDPARRFQTAGEMIEELQDVLEGRGTVRCQVTLTKRMLREMGRFVDRHPRLAMLAVLGMFVSVAFTSLALVRTVLA